MLENFADDDTVKFGNRAVLEDIMRLERDGPVYPERIHTLLRMREASRANVPRIETGAPRITCGVTEKESVSRPNLQMPITWVVSGQELIAVEKQHPHM